MAPNTNQGVRICVDLSRLNRSVKREYHPLPDIETTLGLLAGAKIFSKLDANSGFWQILLDEQSKKLTTFITPFGRYYFNRLPFGISSAPEVFQKRIQRILAGCEGCVCHMDDILVFGKDQAEHDNRLQKILSTLARSGMTLNRDKCLFSALEITFVGHRITQSGITPDEQKVKAIVNMPNPENKKELLRFLGMINFVGRSIPKRSTVCEPLNALLKNNTEWVWDHPQQQAYDEIKRLVATAPALAIFDINKKIMISTDASSYGIGGVMLQLQEDNEWKPVAYVSRTLNDTEKRYANIEREALAITWVCVKLHNYITGLEFEIQTDHKPLIPIFTTKVLDDLSPRLQAFRMKLMRFTYTIGYTPGKHLVTADTLSRKPLPGCANDETFYDPESFIRLVTAHRPISDRKLAEVWSRQEEDEDIKKVIEFTIDKWPETQNLPMSLKRYHTHKSNLSVVDEILLYNNRLVIPKALQQDILGRIHEGHLGISKCRARAAQTVWWPGMSKEIEAMIQKCTTCIKEQVNRKEPMTARQFPSQAWQHVAADLFKFKKWYIVVSDYYSRFLEIEQLDDLTSNAVIDILNKIFSRFGVPTQFYSDGGTQFTSSQFQEFAKEYGFMHNTSSPHFPQSNGFAESSVKIAKRLLLKDNDIHKALLAYRSTPLHNGFSPAELIFNRKIRSTLPMSSSELTPKIIQSKKLEEKEQRHKEKQQFYFNRRHNARNLQPLEPGDRVWVTNARCFGEIVHPQGPRSYM